MLKLYLLAGLIVHKTVWEVLKRRRSTPWMEPAQKQSTTPSATNGGIVTRLIKSIKVAILLGVVAQTLLPDLFPITPEPFGLRLLGILIYTAGLAIAIRSRAHLGTNWSDIETAEVSRKHVIVSRGPYRYIRHPIYIGDLLLLFGLELALNSWLVLGVLLLAPIVLRQAIQEEKELARTLPDYEAYCAHTKRFIPFVV